MPKAHLTLVEQFAAEKMVQENWTLEKMGIHFRRTPAFIKKELQRLNRIAGGDELEYVAYKGPKIVGGATVSENMVRKSGAVVMTPAASERGDTVRESAANSSPSFLTKELSQSRRWIRSPRRLVL